MSDPVAAIRAWVKRVANPLCWSSADDWNTVFDAYDAAIQRAEQAEAEVARLRNVISDMTFHTRGRAHP